MANKYLDYNGLVTLWQKIKTKLSEKVNKIDLASVATSGLYNDLKNTPTVPNGAIYRAEETSVPSGTIELDATLLAGQASTYYTNFQTGKLTPVNQRIHDIWCETE